MKHSAVTCSGFVPEEIGYMKSLVALPFGAKLFTEEDMRLAKSEAVYKAALSYCVNEADQQRIAGFAARIKRGEIE